MSSDGIWCMRFFWRRETLKTRILVSNQAVLHTNNATIGTQNKEKNISEQRHSKRNPRPLYCYLQKKEGKRRWIKRQIHQLNTMQKNINRRGSYTNYTQPIKSASHHQRWAKLANQQASDAARDRSKKVGSPPNQIHIIQKKEGEGERTTEKRQKYRGMQEEEPVHMKRHRKHIHDVEKRETERVNNPSKCANPLMNKHEQQDALHTYKVHLTVCLHWI